MTNCHEFFFVTWGGVYAEHYVGDEVLMSGVEQSIDPLLTVAEVAERLKLDPTTVTRWFADVPGVLDLAPPGLIRRKPKPGSQEHTTKRYRTLRIPESVLNGYLAKRRVA